MSNNDFVVHDTFYIMDGLKNDVETTCGSREDSSHEWKVKWNDRCSMDICAFYNADGGTLIIGRGNDGTFIGVDKPFELVEAIRSTIRKEMSILIEPYVKNIDGKECIVVPIPSGNGVATCDRGFRVRSWDRNLSCNGEMLAKIMMKKYHDGWLNQPFNVDNHALSKRLMKKYASLCSKYEIPFSDDPRSKILDYLNHYHLTIEGKPTLVSAMLFLERPREVDCGAYLRIVVCNTNGIEMEAKDVDSSVIEIAEHTISSMSELLKEHFGIDIDTHYPLEAIREAIINAVEHKKYSIADPVIVSLFYDRIVVSNPSQIDTEGEEWGQYLRIARHVNPELCRATEYAGLATGFGVGLARIERDCEEKKCPKPLIIIENKVFSITLYPVNMKTAPRKRNKRTIAFYNNVDKEVIADVC